MRLGLFAQVPGFADGSWFCLFDSKMHKTIYKAIHITYVPEDARALCFTCYTCCVLSVADLKQYFLEKNSSVLEVGSTTELGRPKRCTAIAEHRDTDAATTDRSQKYPSRI